MRKLIVTILIFVVLLSFPVNAAETSSTTDLIPNSEYTLAKLQEIAVANSRQAQIDNVDIKKKEMTVRTITTDIEAMSDDILHITKPIDVNLELDIAKRTKQDHLDQLKVDVYKTVLSIQLCSKEIALMEKKLEMAKEKLNIVKSRYKATIITQEDVDAAQYKVDSSEVDLANTKEKLGTLYMELRKQLNQPLSVNEVKIIGDIKLETFEDLDVDFSIFNRYKTETSVYKSSSKLDIAQKAMDLATKLYKKGDLTYDNCNMDLEEAKLDLAGAKLALDVKIKNKFNDMLNMKDNIDLASKNEELAKKKLANAKIKYDKGTISREAYMGIEEVLLDAEFAKVSSFVDFDLVKAEFNNFMGIK